MMEPIPEDESIMTKVLLLSHYHGLHGAELALLTLCGGLNKDFKFLVVTPNKGILNDKLSEMGVENLVVPLRRWIEYDANLTPGHSNFSHETVADLVNLIEAYDIDIVQTNTSIIVEGALAARKAGIPHIWHLHEFLENHPSLRCSLPLYFTYKVIETFSERVVVVSQSLAKSVTSYISSDKLRVIPNGLYLKKIDGDVRSELNLSKDSIIITNIGAIIEEKGCQPMVNAAVKICHAYPDVVVLIVGPTADRNLEVKLREQVASHSLESRILFLGYRTDVPAILETTDIYLCPSLMETFSMSIVEAMSFGKPVISTRCGGPEEIVDDEETGLLIPVADVDAMVCAIIKLLESPGDRKKFGKNGKKKYEANYTPEAYWSAFRDMYNRIAPIRVFCDETEKLKDALVELLEAPNLKHHPHHTTSHPTVRRNVHEEKVEELLNSLSWRITSPLRTMYDFLQRFKP